MNIFDELHHRLSSKSRIRALFKDASVQDLERVLARLNEVHQEKLNAREAEEEHRQQKLSDIHVIQKKMAALGLTPSDFNAVDESGKVTDGRRRRNVSKHTFKYQTLSGDSVKWYGSTTGRLPKPFQDYLEKTGKKRTDCIVETED